MPTARKLLLLLVLAVPGCVQTDRTSSGTVHTRKMTREVPTTDGGKVVTEETWTEKDDTSHATAGFDPTMTANIQTGVKLATAVATGDWSQVAVIGAGAAATLAAAWAGRNSGKVASLTDRVEEHKADADEGWKMALAAASAPTAAKA